MSSRVHGADGRAWIIRRHWMSIRPRWRGRSPSSEGSSPWNILDIADLGLVGDDLVGAGTVITGILIVVVVVVMSVLFAVPALLLAAELMAVLLLGAGVLVANVVFRRPWIVEARTHDGREVYRWAVVGWRRTERIIEAVGAALRSGVDPELSVPPSRAKLIEAKRREDQYARGPGVRPHPDEPAERG